MSIHLPQIKQLKNLLQVGSDEQILSAVEKVNPSDIATLFSELNPDQIRKLVDYLFAIKKAGKTLKELPEFMLPDILELVDEAKLPTILDRLEPDDAAYLLSKLPEPRWQGVLEKTDSKKRIQVEKLLIYPKDSAGSVMNPHFFSVPVESTAEEALRTLQSYPDKEGIFYVYIIDRKRLVGVLPLRNLVISMPQTEVRKIMKTDLIMIEATQDQEVVAQLVSQYNLLAIPVVNENRELLGVITVDDVIDIFEEEATEDIYNMVGLSEVDRAFTSVAIKTRKRLPWTLLNLATAFLAAGVVSFFEGAIGKLALLAVYMPIVAGLGGNSGTQSLVVITRSMALGELQLAKASQAILKEVLTGLSIGLAAGLVGGLASYFINGKPFLGVILFLAMVINLFVAGLMGALVPVTFKWFKLDPAVGSSVVLTTMTDCTGFFVFLGLSQIFIEKLL
jgi:magnesium transporter